MSDKHEHGRGCDQELCEDWADEPDCSPGYKHEWTGDGMGGLDANPGVWNAGGTAYVFKRRCLHCGVIRTETCFGVQRNEYKCDTRTFEAADPDEAYET